MRNSIFFVLVVASLESGCGAKLPSVKPFKLDIQQGNVVTSKMLLQLRPGMTRSQVRYIMGTPLIVDSFRDNRWDYFYELRKQGVVVEKRRVILDFDKDSLVSVRGDVIAAGDNPDVKTIAETSKTETAEADQAWTDKLKFWKDGAAENAAKPEAKTAASDTSAGKMSAAAPVAAAVPAQKNTAQAAPTAKSAEENAANDDNEVVPYIPEGDYSAALAPSPDDMVKGNMAEANQPPEPAQARQVTEKGVAPKAESAAASTPVFEQEAMPAPQVSAEPEPVLPPPAKPAAVAAPRVVEAKPVEAKAAVAATAVAAVAVAKPKESSAPTTAAKPPVQPATVKQSEKPTVAPVANTAMEDDEVIPFIPEGEYAEPVIPTQEEMVKGNMASSNTAAEDAATHAVTEKGVAAPASAEAAEPPPTFVAEQMPEPAVEPEPELPPPPALKPKAANAVPAPSSAPAPVVAPAVAAAEPEAKPASKPMTPALKPVAPVVAALPAQEEAAKDAPVGDADINKAVAAWAQAWRGKNVNAYLAAYAPDFVPEGLPSRSVWEAQRKQRLSAKQGPITLVLNNLQVERDGNSAVVQFDQKYAAKSYKDELLKTLELRYEPTQKRWLITRERVTPLIVSAPAVAAAQVSEPAVSAQATVAEQSAPAATPEVGAAVGVESAVQAWAQAWRSKNINNYLAAYAPDFVPEGLPSKRAWEAQRKQRLSAKQGPITLEISDIDVQQNGDEATVTFTQKYASKAYRDEMQKKLQLRYSAGQNAWLIVRETASAAATSPAAKRDVTAPEGSAEHLDGVLEQIGF